MHQHLTVHGRHLETDKPACQSAVRCLAAQVVQIPQLRRTIDVERQQSNTLQAEVHRLGPQLCQNVDKFTEDVAQLQARCHDFGLHPEPTQHTRDEGFPPSRAGVDANGRQQVVEL